MMIDMSVCDALVYMHAHVSVYDALYATTEFRLTMFCSVGSI